ncbi:MAG: DUF255 domain-containing protein [Gemmatimonadota bacterium]
MASDHHAVASPVQWLEWGPEAFARAQREDKPILLRISAVWCHWCHVMDDTTDADPEVARRVNEWFVPLRVDNDERPDVNDRYNLGGWPTTAFLTPDGELITGGTYFPAAQFSDILERVHHGWVNDREAIDAAVENIRERRTGTLAERPQSDAPDARFLTTAVESVLDAFDWRYGGFGTQPKFPHPEAVRLLLHAYHGSGADAPLEAAKKTLVAMRDAGLSENRAYGLYDHRAGGFFRYSTTRDWSEPHFEKMAEDNARLAMAYLDAYRLTGKERFEDSVRGIFSFVLETLSHREGGAFGSQDADGEAEYYGLELVERAKRSMPTIDHRLYTNWNGMMVVAGFEAAAVLNWPELIEWCELTVERLTSKLCTSDGAMRHVLRPPYGGDSVDVAAPLLLTDQAWWMAAQLAAFQSTGVRDHFMRAEKLAHVIERDFFDAKRGACRDRSFDARGDGILDEPHYPLSDNAAAASGFAALTALGGDERWRERAESIVQALAGEGARFGLLGASLALAAIHVMDMPVQIHLVGPTDDVTLRTLWRAAWRRYMPSRVTEILDPDRDPARLELLGYPLEGDPRAYVCIGDRCLEPVTAPDALERQLESIGRR